MRTARPVGLTPDGVYLIVATGDGEEIGIPADDRLKAALRADRPRLGQLEIEMDSALRPRDIQARIRAGEPVEDVARAAGVPIERLDAFAAPVIAEREHVAGLAQTHPIRRRGETTSHRPLRTAVRESLASRGIDYDAVSWDAWKVGDRRWQVRASYASGSARHEGLFLYDQTGRFTTAHNDDARWMIGDETPLHGPQPGRRSPSRPDADDELALVRAIQSAPSAGSAEAHADGEKRGGQAAASGLDIDDAYTEGELTEVDGVYDIVPGRESEMDVLYDMLSSFDEDSVKIYAGLVHPGGEGEGEPTATREEVGAEVDHAHTVEPEAVAEPEAPMAEPEALDLAAPQEPEQPALVAEDQAPPPSSVPPKPKKRTSVPSWDEIMFGAAPKKDK